MRLGEAGRPPRYMRVPEYRELDSAWTRSTGSPDQGGGRMRARRVAIVSSVLATFLAVASRAGEVTLADVAQADNRFGFELFAELARRNPGTNILISPASIAFALGIAYTGAGGETAAEMARVLELQGLDIETVNDGHATVLKSLQAPASGVELRVANSLWAERRVTFHPAFIQ